MGQQSKLDIVLDTMEPDALIDLYGNLFAEWFRDTYTVLHDNPPSLDNIESRSAWNTLSMIALASEGPIPDLLRMITPMVWETCDEVPAVILAAGRFN